MRLWKSGTAISSLRYILFSQQYITIDNTKQHCHPQFFPPLRRIILKLRLYASWFTWPGGLTWVSVLEALRPHVEAGAAGSGSGALCGQGSLGDFQPSVPLHLSALFLNYLPV